VFQNLLKTIRPLMESDIGEQETAEMTAKRKRIELLTERHGGPGGGKAAALHGKAPAGEEAPAGACKGRADTTPMCLAHRVCRECELPSCALPVQGKSSGGRPRAIKLPKGASSLHRPCCPRRSARARAWTRSELCRSARRLCSFLYHPACRWRAAHSGAGLSTLHNADESRHGTVPMRLSDLHQLFRSVATDIPAL
jgi:hypothetical protein